MESRGGFHRAVIVCILVLALAGGVHAQYAGGSGTADDPYLIATGQDLIDLGNTPHDCDKHFILANDIDLTAHSWEGALIGTNRGWHSKLLQQRPSDAGRHQSAKEYESGRRRWGQLR